MSTRQVPKQYNKFSAAEWITCPVCLGRFVCHEGRGLKVSGIPICAWCYGRGGKALMLFVQLVSQLSNRPCETKYKWLTEEAQEKYCKCVPCTSNRIMEYRQRLIGVQDAPIKA